METAVEKAKVLLEAMPFIRRFQGRTFVIKYGGHAMVAPELKESFAKDVCLLKYIGINVVVVHGGGPQISKMLTQSGVQSRFVDGLRVTDDAAMEVVEMVLAGSINQDIVSLICRHGGRAVGISGKDARLVVAEKVGRSEPDRNSSIERHVDLGFVGEPTTVDRTILDTLSASGVIPVVAPVAIGADGHTYNINADTMAGAIAAALGASRLFLLTDVAGVLDKEKKLLSDLVPEDVERLKADGTISGGMIPKMETCVTAIRAGVDAAVILDGRIRHAMLLEIFTRQGAGTLVRAG